MTSMRPAAFLARQWPKVHDSLVEECVAAGRVVHVSDWLPRLDAVGRDLLWSWSPLGTPPGVRLVARMGGPFKRWWLRCPRCGALRDALYRPTGTDAWACRVCHGLIFSSQRYGPRHPLSRVLTPRKRASRRKLVARQERQWARGAVKRRGWLAAMPSAEADEEAVKMAEEFRERLAQQARDHWAIAEDMRARIAAEASRSLAVLRELAVTAKSRKLRQRARRALGRYEGPRPADDR